MGPLIDLDPTTFESRFRSLVESGAPDEEFDAVDDQIGAALFGDQAASAAACARLAVDILEKVDRPWSLAYALSTHIGACCAGGNTEGVRLGLERLVEVTARHGTIQAALSAAANVERLLPGNAKPDHVTHILHQVARLYVEVKRPQEAIRTMIIAAHLFADYGAFQTAYRTLHDAETLARDHALSPQFADVGVAMHGICLLEGDHDNAEKTWELLQQVFLELGKPIPTGVALNRARPCSKSGSWSPRCRHSRQSFHPVK